MRQLLYQLLRKSRVSSSVQYVTVVQIRGATSVRGEPDFPRPSIHAVEHAVQSSDVQLASI